MNETTKTDAAAIAGSDMLAEAVFKPILFSTQMVQAILRGEKTQTRRLCHFYKAYDIFSDGKHEVEAEKTIENMKPAKFNVGDILWVRETFQNECEEIQIAGGDWSNAYFNATGNFVYRADGEGLPKDSIAFGKWKPSLFMPKQACRIFLKVTDVRVERLNEISEADALAEGIERWTDERMKSKPTHYKIYFHEKGSECSYTSCPIDSYETLWQKINGEKSWSENPFVWVYTFKQVERPYGFC